MQFLLFHCLHLLVELELVRETERSLILLLALACDTTMTTEQKGTCNLAMTFILFQSVFEILYPLKSLQHSFFVFRHNFFFYFCNSLPT